MLALLKNHLNYLKNNIFKCFSKEYNRLYFFKKLVTFFIKKDNGKFKY